MALGLIVTDMEGRPITFARASGRFFAKIITGMIPFGIGYIMAGFTEKKQALHDMIASCLVLQKNLKARCLIRPIRSAPDERAHHAFRRGSVR